MIAILSDSKKLSKLLEDLKKADKDAKDSLKELAKGKALKAASEEMRKEAEDYKKEVDKAKKFLSTVKDKAEKIEKDSLEAVSVREKELNEISSDVKAKLKQAEVMINKAQEELEASKKANAKAQLEKDKAQEVRKQYEKKLFDLKSRFAGLVE